VPIETAVNIADLRVRAKRRLPKVLFDWIDGGAGDEAGVRASIDAFAAHRFAPRYLVDVSRRDLSKDLFGRTWGLPFGVAPTGFAGLFWTDGDLLLAQAARAANVPFILSGTSVATIEEAAARGVDNLWFQLYAARDPSITRDLLSRAQAVGITTLVLTVDLPVPAKRERDIRNGFGAPLTIDARKLLDAALHPAWTLQWLQRGGMPMMGSWARYAPKGATPQAVAMFMNAQLYATQTWTDLERYRQQWPGRLVIKGLQHPDDAARAVDAGCDGIIVSNHGGRQFDRAPTPLESLPAIRAAVDGRIPVMLDGGVRRGADIAIALCLGADFVFTGRATLWGLAAGGLPGASYALKILKDELDVTLGQIGRTTIAQLTRDALWGM